MSNDAIQAAGQSFELTGLLIEFSNALAATTEAMEIAYASRPELRERGVIYQIPRMSVEVKMSLAYTQGKIRGAFVFKNKEDTTAELTSTVNMDFVAVPRPADSSVRRLLRYTTPLMFGEDVLQLQTKLQQVKGIRRPAADKYFGIQTLAAVIEFQKLHMKRETLLPSGLPPEPEKAKDGTIPAPERLADGVVDDLTYAKLLELVPDPGRDPRRDNQATPIP